MADNIPKPKIDRFRREMVHRIDHFREGTALNLVEGPAGELLCGHVHKGNGLIPHPTVMIPSLREEKREK